MVCRRRWCARSERCSKNLSIRCRRCRRLAEAEFEGPTRGTGERGMKKTAAFDRGFAEDAQEVPARGRAFYLYADVRNSPPTGSTSQNDAGSPTSRPTHGIDFAFACTDQPITSVFPRALGRRYREAVARSPRWLQDKVRRCGIKQARLRRAAQKHAPPLTPKAN